MKNLEHNDVLCDDGEIDEQTIVNISVELGVSFNKIYIDFIALHNGASLISKDCFDFFDKNKQKRSSSSIAFLNVLQIIDDAKSLLEQTTDDENDLDIFKFYHYFDKWLIPFGENGGGDFICFDYRENQKTDDPKIVFWSHDAADPDGRISFIANTFEEFINMLHEPEDEDFVDTWNHDPLI